MPHAIILRQEYTLKSLGNEVKQVHNLGGVPRLVLSSAPRDYSNCASIQTLYFKACISSRFTHIALR